MTHDRRALVDDIVTARAMAVATLPADEAEPDAWSTFWPVGIGKVLASAGIARDADAKRDLVVLAGAHIVGWLEAIDEALGDPLGEAANDPES